MRYMGTIKPHIPLLAPLFASATHCAHHIKTKHQENYHAHCFLLFFCKYTNFLDNTKIYLILLDFCSYFLYRVMIYNLRLLVSSI